jgi:hypothetical protein
MFSNDGEIVRLIIYFVRFLLIIVKELRKYPASTTDNYDVTGPQQLTLFGGGWTLEFSFDASLFALLLPRAIMLLGLIKK